MNILLLIIGFIIGLFLSTPVLLPILYFLPKAIYFVFKGVLRGTSILVILATPFIWLFISLTIFFVVIFLFPSLVESKYIIISSALGLWIGGISDVYGIFNTKRRKAANNDFWAVMTKYLKSNSSPD